MPRTTHTLQKVERPGRSSFFQASVGGKKVYLGTDKREASKRLRILTRGESPSNERPRTVAGLIDLYVDAHPGAEEQYLDAWRRFIGDDRALLADIKPGHLQQYHAYLEAYRFRRKLSRGKLGPRKPYSNKTIRHYLSAAAAVLTWAHGKGWVATPPMKPKTATPITTPRDMPLEAVRALLETLPRATRAIVGFIFHTGCRPSEACRLRWEWFRPADGGSGSFVLPAGAHKTGEKTGSSRTIYLTPDARAIVDLQPRARALVFLNTRGLPFTADAIQSATNRRGVVSPYTLRHTFATSALARGVPLHIVGELLGHRNIATTQRYVRVMSQQASMAAAGLGGLLPAESTAALSPTPAASTPAPPARQRRRRSQG